MLYGICMNKRLLGWSAFVLGAALCLSPLAVALPVNAQATGGQGLEISPPVIELSADPGQTITANIRVRNVTAATLITKGKADDFGAGTSEDGAPHILLDETGATRYSLKYWISGVPDLKLAPRELKTTTVTITIPKNAEPGGHFGVVRFTGVAPGVDGTGVALSASVGSLILLKVSGAITDKMSLAEFSAYQTNTKTKKDVTGSFFEYGPVGFLVRLKNEGSVHERPGGSIDVTDWMGHKVATVKVDEQGGSVLPDSIRRFTQTLNQKQLFGRYSAHLALSYATGKIVDNTIEFWVIPMEIIVTCLGWHNRYGVPCYSGCP